MLNDIWFCMRFILMHIHGHTICQIYQLFNAAAYSYIQCTLKGHYWNQSDSD